MQRTALMWLGCGPSLAWACALWLPGDTFASPSFTVLVSIVRYEVVAAILVTLFLGLKVADLLGYLEQRIGDSVWGASMVWWIFVALCLGAAKFNSTGTFIYLFVAAVTAAAWAERRKVHAHG